MTEATGNAVPNGPAQPDETHLTTLRTSLAALHDRSGAPSVRVIASRTSNAISHTTVHSVLRCRKLPAWGQLELVVEQLGGDLDEFKQLWISALNEKRGTAPTTVSLVAEPKVRRIISTADGEEKLFDSTEVVGDLLRPLLDVIESTAQGHLNRVTTGFTDLDRLLNGLRPGQLTVVAGRPGVGKSMFALSVARNAAVRQTVPVLFMSFQRSALDLTMWLVAAEGRLALHTLQAGMLTEGDWTKLARTMTAVADVPLYINDDRNPGIEGVVVEARKIAIEHGIGLLVVDSVADLIDDGEGGKTRATIFSTLKRVAVELNVSVMAVDTLPFRPGEFHRVPEAPTIEELQGIGEASDIVIIIHRDDLYDLDSPRAGEADFIVARHRHGPTDTVTTAAQLHLARFVDIAVV